MHEKQLCNQIQPKDFFRIVLMAETVQWYFPCYCFDIKFILRDFNRLVGCWYA